MLGGKGQDLRILLVVHRDSDRLLLERVLRDPAPLPGPVALTVVPDAKSALDVLRSKHFSVILVDDALPDRPGRDLLPDIRAVRPDVPVVMVTDADDDGAAATAVQHGAADYVVKQLGFERALPIVIGRVLARPGGAT